MNIGTDIHDKKKVYPFKTWIDGMIWIKEKHQALKLYGIIVDAFTANAVLTVYDSLSDKNKEFIKNDKNTESDMIKFVDFSWSQIK